MAVKLIPVDGVAMVDAPKSADYPLEYWQELVEGDMEIIAIGEACSIVVNQDGLLIKMPINKYASQMFNMMLVGPVVVITGSDIKLVR